MGGSETFSGTTYQADAIAYIYVHVLAQMRLGWLEPDDDTPLAVSGETDGPGDDAKIEFGDGHLPVELQVKHGLTAGAKLREVLERVRTKSTPDSKMRVVLAVNRDSSRIVHADFAQDLERLRAGRQDGLKSETTRLLEEPGIDVSLLKRLFVVKLDLERNHDPEVKFAFKLLADSVLEDPERVDAAWRVLADDANNICARKLRRTRAELVKLLTGAKIKVRHPVEDDRWHRQLDFSHRLLHKGHTAAILDFLKQLEKDIGESKVGAGVRYRIKQQQASAFIRSGRYDEAHHSARRALDEDANGSEALVLAAQSAIYAGNIERATTFVERALHAHPGDPQAWGAKAELAVACGRPLPEPPANVSTAAHYRLVLAKIAGNAKDWQRALEITTKLMAEGERGPVVLLLHGHALLERSSGGDVAADRVGYEDAERLASELIDDCPIETHPLRIKGLLLRAETRRLLGRADEADADLQLALELNASDPETIARVAYARIDADDESAALDILRNTAASKNPHLLALRANLLADRGEKSDARSALELAISQLANTPNQDQARLMIAESALSLSDIDLAENMLRTVTAEATKTDGYALVEGRAAFARRDVEKGAVCYREAVSRNPRMRVIYLAELGYKLHQSGRYADSVRAFDDVGVDALPQRRIPVYVDALAQVNDLVRMKSILDKLAEQGPLPSWGVYIAATLALRQEDFDVAMKYVSTLIERGYNVPQSRIQMAQILVGLDRQEDALQHLDALLAESELSPLERMTVAQIFHGLGRNKEARQFAFRAFRDAPHAPWFHRAFISIMLRNDGEQQIVSAVGPDTYLRLRSHDGEVREHTIYVEPPFNPLRGEMSVVDAEAAGYIGKHVSDIIVQHAGSWREKSWTVEKIKPAIDHVFQEAMSHYEERFPGEPFFMAKFKVEDLNSPKAFAPLIASLENKKKFVERAMDLYQKERLMLGLLAKSVGSTVADVMEYVTSRPHGTEALWVEWPGQREQEESLATAYEAAKVVLTRSALKTIMDTGLRPHLESVGELIAPSSLVVELRREIHEAERLVAQGRKVLIRGDIGLMPHEVPSGDPSLVKLRDDTRELLAWLEASARIEPRPLALIHPPRSKEEEMRDGIGHSSFDAVALAHHFAATMYADDIGLRRVSLTGTLVRSFSTVALLSALVRRGSLSSDERDHHLLDLIAKNYVAILPTVELLTKALRRMSEPGRPRVAHAFATLGWVSGPAEAARIAVRVIKSLLIAPIQIVPTETAVRLALGGMSSRWPAPLCAEYVADAATDELVLLPQHLVTVRRICSEFARGAIPQLQGD